MKHIFSYTLLFLLTSIPSLDKSNHHPSNQVLNNFLYHLLLSKTLNSWICLNPLAVALFSTFFFITFKHFSSLEYHLFLKIVSLYLVFFHLYSSHTSVHINSHFSHSLCRFIYFNFLNLYSVPLLDCTLQLFFIYLQFLYCSSQLFHYNFLYSKVFLVYSFNILHSFNILPAFHSFNIFNYFMINLSFIFSLKDLFSLL